MGEEPRFEIVPVYRCSADLLSYYACFYPILAYDFKPFFEGAE